jgi:hypothetical protein
VQNSLVAQSGRASDHIHTEGYWFKSSQDYFLNLKNMRKVTDFEVARKMVTLAGNAEKRGAPFEMTFKRVKYLLKQEKCYYTGVIMTEAPENSPTTRTFDKVDPDKGYTDSNVVACCFDINNKKANLTFKQISMLYNKLKKR